MSGGANVAHLTPSERDELERWLAVRSNEYQSGEGSGAADAVADVECAADRLRPITAAHLRRWVDDLEWLVQVSSAIGGSIFDEDELTCLMLFLARLRDRLGAT